MRLTLPIALALLVPLSAIAEETWREPLTGIEFVRMPAGCYVMGDTFGKGEANEQPPHEVCLKNFWIGRHEVTQGEWQKAVSHNPSVYLGDERLPVDSVNQMDIAAFIFRLGETNPGRTFRLPTEAEWEYAARSGGLNQKYSGGSDVNVVAWYSGNAVGTTHPVGGKTGTVPYGLYDMSGNVWEVVSDWFGDYSSAAQTNPTGPATSIYGHVIRGGSWSNLIVDGERTSARGYFPLTSKYTFVGFRLAASP